MLLENICAEVVRICNDAVRSCKDSMLLGIGRMLLMLQGCF
jgi:hypothetical protein